MKYFGYSTGGRNSSQFQLTRIYNAVQKMKNLAIARYGGRYQDALDAAFFHIVDNYDESVGDSDESLEHYTASIVNTIYRNNSKKEVLSEMVLDIESSNQMVKEMEVTDPYTEIEIGGVVEFEKNVSDCIEELFPNFLKDYDIFAGKKTAVRKMNYRSVYKNFSDAVINEAVKRMSVDCEKAGYLAELSRECHLRTFAPDRYKSSVDESIRFDGVVNGIVVCTYASSRVKRNVYKVLIKEFIDEVVNRFYTAENPIGYRNICGHDIYCTLSGKEVEGEDALRKSIEYDIVGALLAKVVNLRVVDYQEGKHFYVSSSKPEEYGLYISAFGTDVLLEMTRMTVRRVVSQGC